MVIKKWDKQSESWQIKMRNLGGPMRAPTGPPTPRDPKKKKSALSTQFGGF